MKVKELLEYNSSTKPHVYPESVLLLWLNEVEGRVQLDILKKEKSALRIYGPEDMDEQLLVPAPHTGVYRYHMAAMVDLENGEDGKYRNDMALFNRAWEEYACWHEEVMG